MRNWLIALFVVCAAARGALAQDLIASGEPSQEAYYGAAPEPTVGACAVNPVIWAEADHVYYWLKPVCLKPVTLSIGNLADAEPGIPGQPGTQIVQGGHKFEFQGANGIRPRVGTWFTDDASFGLEAEGFVLEKVSASQDFSTDSGSPPTYLLYQNADNSYGVLPFSIPGVVNGSSTAVGSTRLWGLEANLSAHGSTQRGGWDLHATLLAGCRYLHLNDQVVITNRQSLVSDPSVFAVGESNFATRNQFIGGQIGARFGLARGPLALDLTTKLALGESHLVSDVSGSPLLAGSSVQSGLIPGPLLAMPTNIGTMTSDRISVVPEFNLRLRWRATEHVQLTFGYNLLYWNKVLCPGDQMDSHVNITQIAGFGPFVGARNPAPQFVFTDAFAHGVEGGLEFSF